jgi:hypothetical protein
LGIDRAVAWHEQRFPLATREHVALKMVES